MTGVSLRERLAPLRGLRHRISVIEPAARWWARQSKAVQAAVIVTAAAFAIFYPPTLSQGTQSILFFPVGLYVLLALGLNIVVGAAGLLDLGYVAFYAVGAYTTAMVTTKSGWTAWEALPSRHSSWR